MRNGAPHVCHVVFKLNICFPLIFCEESTSGSVILSPHYNALFITISAISLFPHILVVGAASL